MTIIDNLQNNFSRLNLFFDQGLLILGNHAEKTIFLENFWQPFLKKMTEYHSVTNRAQELGFTWESRLPSQKTFLEFQEECLLLTQVWYGKQSASLSAVYHFFIELYHAAGLTAYSWKSAPKTTVFNGDCEVISSQTAILKKHYIEEIRAQHLKQGGVGGGRSLIDDVLLPNVMLSSEAHILLVGFHIKRFLVKLLQKVQLQLIKNKADLKGGGLARQLLNKFNQPLENWGQFSQTLKVNLFLFLQDRFSSLKVARLYKVFNEFLKKQPEHYFISRPLHLKIMARGLEQGQLTLIKRVTMEDEFTARKYLCFGWNRQVALTDLAAGPASLKIRRPQGAREYTRLRVNDICYRDTHGLGLSTSGNLEGLKHHNTLPYNINLICDAGARLPNLNLLDIEKVIIDTVSLNPKTKDSAILPGEHFYSGRQNPAWSASIPQTQHIHIFRGVLKDFPVYNQQTKPVYSQAIDGDIDLVQMGHSPDSFFVKILTDKPLSAAIIYFLNDLKQALLGEPSFKGHQGIDFELQVMPDGAGKFAIVLFPCAQMQKTIEGEHFVLINTYTQQTSDDCGLGPLRYGLCTAGLFALEQECAYSYQEVVAKFYDLLHCPGSRVFVEAFIYQRLAINFSSEAHQDNSVSSLKVRSKI